MKILKLGSYRALVCFSIGLTAAVGTAGERRESWVVVSQTTRNAFGALGGARNAPDNVQFIGCQTRMFGGRYRMGCVATDSAGVTATCQSTRAEYIALAQSVGTDSWIWFTYDALGNCQDVIISNYSFYEPKEKCANCL
jgi:hypothetical protein